MKKYIVLRGENKNGVACFDDTAKRLKINLDGYERLAGNEYFSAFANGVCIGKFKASRAVFKLEKLDGGIEIMRCTAGKKDVKKEYISEGKIGDEKQEAKPPQVSETDFKWQKVRGYYCMKNTEIAKFALSGEKVYASINKKGYYLFGETDDKFAVAVASAGGGSPFIKEVDKFAEKVHINGGDFYAVFMGSDSEGEYFLKLK